MLPQPLLQVVRGFCMGAADIVPGVSGGTVALLFGIYQRLVDNIRTGAGALGHLVKADLAGFVRRLREVEWSFLLPLLAGIGTALVALSSIIETLLHDHPESMAGLFLGLVAASVVVAGREMSAGWQAATIASASIAAVVTFVVLGIKGGTVDDPSYPVFFIAGAIAICAMILPGVSGSFLLLMMGMYAPVLTALNDRDLPPLVVFTVGVVIGLALFSTLLHWLLHHHGDVVIAAMIGLMIGSIRVLWPWPNGVGTISEEEADAVSGTGLQLPDSFASFFWPTLWAVLAAGIVLGVATLTRRTEPVALREPVA